MLFVFVFAFAGIVRARKMYELWRIRRWLLRSLDFDGSGGSGLMIRWIWIAMQWNSYDFRAETVKGGGGGGFASELVLAFAVVGAEQLRGWRVGGLDRRGLCCRGGFGGEVIGDVFCLWYACEADLAC